MILEQDVLDKDGKPNWSELIKDITGDLHAQGFETVWGTLEELIHDWIEGNSNVDHYVKRYEMDEESVEELLQYLNETWSDIREL